MGQAPQAIYLHIGHGKTGSSYLQSALALSVSDLRDRGVLYPIAEDLAERAGMGHISGGNLRGAPGALTKVIEEQKPGPDQRLLISAESFFMYLVRHGAEFAAEYNEICPGVPLKVLCFLRDPVDHAVSVYQQRVKRGGYTGTLADSLDKYEIPGRTVAVLQALRDMGAEITVLNYSRHRDDLLPVMERWLDLPADALTRPAVGQVNRSMTNAELEFQRLMNTHMGTAAGRFVSDPLCNQLPDIKSERPPLDEPSLAAFLDRMATEIAAPEYQDLVPEAERPVTGSVADHIDRFPRPADGDAQVQFSFSAQQLAVLAEALSAPMGRQAAGPKKAGPRKAGPGKAGRGAKRSQAAGSGPNAALAQQRAEKREQKRAAQQAQREARQAQRRAQRQGKQPE